MSYITRKLLISCRHSMLPMQSYLKAIFLLVVLQGIAFMSTAQNGINVYHDVDAKGKLNFYCVNENHCDYTVEVHFTDLINLRSNVPLPYKGVAKRGRNLLFSLEPRDPNYAYDVLYTSTSFKGCADPTIDQSFRYLLPLSAGQTTQPIQMEYLKINENDRTPKDYYALVFKMNAGDTIYASRRGVISSLKDNTHLPLADYVYSSDDNFIEIFHRDCTFGHYEVLEKSLVSLGQEVEAGDPIAIAGGENYVEGSHVRFFVIYINQIPNQNRSVVTLSPAYVPLSFCTAENQNAPLIFDRKYTCIKPESVITQEFTKRQLKNWRK